jgi:hypothetical protein
MISKGRQAVVVSPAGIELLHDAGDIAHGRACGIRISAVGDELYVGALPGEQASLELRVDLHDQQRAPPVDQRADIGRALQVCDALEHAGTVQSREQLARRRRVVLIQRRVGDMIEVVGGRISEDQRLHHRRNEQTHAAAGIFQHRKQFLASEGENPQKGAEHGIHSRVLRMTSRLASASMAAIAASASVLGRITDQTLPARNTLCNSAT